MDKATEQGREITNITGTDNPPRKFNDVTPNPGPTSLHGSGAGIGNGNDDDTQNPEFSQSHELDASDSGEDGRLKRMLLIPSDSFDVADYSKDQIQAWLRDAVKYRRHLKGK